MFRPGTHHTHRTYLLIGCLLSLALLALAPTAPARAAGSIIYVKASASGQNDGSSWANAYTSLQSALAAATSGDQIWVAAGSYKPSTTGDRSASFTLTSGVALYGGFAGSETLLSQRDWTSNVTILSGDLNGNDSGFTNNGENSYHVVRGATGATLDGFTITGGNANVISGTSDIGGGIYNNGSSPMLSNLIVSGNSSTNFGGGIYNNSSSPTLTNMTISGNKSINGGGIYNNNSSNPTLTNVTIAGNRVTGNGGGIDNISSSPTLTNVIISGNSASIYGGGMYNAGSSNPTLTNVTIAGNRATSIGGGMRNLNSSPQIRNSIVWGNRVGTAASSVANSSSTPVVSYSIVEGGYSGTGNLNLDPKFVTSVDAASAPTTSGDLRLLANSPAIDAGDNSVLPTDSGDLDGDSNTAELVPNDLDGYARQIDVTSVADTGSGTAPIVDMGAYEAIVVNVSSITRLNPASATTNAVSVTFRVVFAQSLTGVDTSDFTPSVVSGSITGTSVTSVSGSGATWDVSVNTGSSDGVLRLDIASAARAVNASSQALSIPSYTSGETYTIDKTFPTAPTITGITSDSGTSSSDGITSDPTLVLNGTAEANSTVSVTLIGTGVIGTTADASGNWSYDYTATSLADGSYSFTASATDAAGNTSPASATFAVTIDTTIVIPVISSLATDSGTPGDGITSDPTLILSGTAEAGSSVSIIRVGSGVIGTTTADASGSWSYDYTATSLADGSYSFTASATDVAGNTSPASATFAVTIDGIAPMATVNQAAAQADPTGAAPIFFTVVFDEPVSGFDAAGVSLSGTAGPTTATVTGSGASYTVAVSGMTANGTVVVDIAAGAASDAAGNTSLAATSTDNTVTFDATVPVVTGSARANSDPTNAGSVQFIVTFNKRVSGVDTSDFTLTTAGITDAVITDVSGSNSTWIVTVTTGTGDGTIRLDVGDDDTIVDDAGNRLGGAGTGNGGFTAGQIYTVDKSAPAAPAIVSISSDSGSSAGDGVTSDPTLILTGTAEANSTISLTRIDSGALGTTSADASGSWSYDYTATSLADGSYSFTASATDAAGSTSPTSAALAVTIDTSVPVAAIAAQLPNPRTTAVDSIAISFSKPVTGFGLADLGLTRDGQPVILTGATLTGSGASYIVGNLGQLTSSPGSYALTLSAVGAGIVDLAGNGLGFSASATWTLVPVTQRTFTAYLPFIVAASLPVSPALPDLVGQISLSPNKVSLAASEPVLISVTITNQGTAPSTPAWADVFINPSKPPTAPNQIWSACACPIGTYSRFARKTTFTQD
jgi:hypothetical protein